MLKIKKQKTKALLQILSIVCDDQAVSHFLEST